jgi:hypothetical protein
MTGDPSLIEPAQRNEPPKLARRGIPTLDACWLCYGSGTATARTSSAP